MKPIYYVIGGTAKILSVALFVSISAHESSVVSQPDGKRLFERETFGGNGRTCSTCHTSATGTISPIEAHKRFKATRAIHCLFTTAAMMETVRARCGC